MNASANLSYSDASEAENLCPCFVKWIASSYGLQNGIVGEVHLLSTRLSDDRILMQVKTLTFANSLNNRGKMLHEDPHLSN